MNEVFELATKIVMAFWPWGLIPLPIVIFLEWRAYRREQEAQRIALKKENSWYEQKGEA